MAAIRYIKDLQRRIASIESHANYQIQDIPIESKNIKNIKDRMPKKADTITSSPHGLALINNLHPRLYDNSDIGIIPTEVEDAMKELKIDDFAYKNQIDLIPILVRGMKELISIYEGLMEEQKQQAVMIQTLINLPKLDVGQSKTATFKEVKPYLKKNSSLKK